MAEYGPSRKDGKGPDWFYHGVDEGAQQDITEERTDGDHSQAKPKSNVVTIVAFLGCAFIPAVMGILFQLSLGLSSPLGHHYHNGTFVRPNQDGLNAFGHSVSPLLLSSISSTVISMISFCVMSLLCFHLAHRWLTNSPSTPRPAKGSDTLPTPYQFFLILNLASSASPFAFVRFLQYAIWRSPRREPGVPPRRFFPRAIPRAPIGSLLATTAWGLFIVLFFSTAIKIIDVVLHQKIQAAIIQEPRGELIPNTNAFLKPECQRGNDTFNACPVLDRLNEASTGALNQTKEHAFYQNDEDSGPFSNNRSISFIAPQAPTLARNAAVLGRTFALASECNTWRPLCNQSSQVVQTCYGITSPTTGLDTNFDVSTWQTRPQILLDSQGYNNVQQDGQIYTNFTQGGVQNPFNTTGWLCFDDYSSIRYDDTNRTFETPYVNWFMLGRGISNQPKPLCFVFTCGHTIYDAAYSAAWFPGRNRIALVPNDDQAWVLSNGSVAAAITGSLTYIENQPTTAVYPYTERFLDSQIQFDLNNFGNNLGNDTEQFNHALAQALSNRILGWSTGTFQSSSEFGYVNETVLGLQIPVILSITFSALHLIYALIIFALGLSCLAIPSVRSGLGHRSKRGGLSEKDTFQPDSNDVAMAHSRMTDGATLVAEVVTRDLALKYRGKKNRPTLDRTGSDQTLIEAESETESRGNRWKGIDLGVRRISSEGSLNGGGGDGLLDVEATRKGDLKMAMKRDEVSGELRMVLEER